MTFSIRDLFWLTVVVALAVAWWVDRRQSAEIAEANRKLTSDLEMEHLRREAMAKALDKSWPGWRDKDGGYEFNLSINGMHLVPKMPLPNSPAPVPNPPKP